MPFKISKSALLLWAGLGFLSLSRSAFALDPAPETDAYGLGMGDAVAAVAGGTHAIEWNPAGAARATVPMVQLGLGFQTMGRGFSLATGALYPFPDGTVFALSQFSHFPDSPYSSTVYVGTVALPLTSSRDFLLGINLKYLALSADGGDAVLWGRGLGLDLGLSYDLRRPEGTLASFALAVKDLNTQVRFNNMAEEAVARTFVLGAAYQALPDTRVEMDYDIVDQTLQTSPLQNRLRLGAERFFGDKSYSVRVGYDGLFGNDGYLSLGAGYHPAQPFELTYAFRASTAGSGISNSLSFIYRFDHWGARQVAPAPAGGASAEINISNLSALTEAPTEGRPVSPAPLHKMNIEVEPSAFSPSGSRKTVKVSFPDDRSTEMARWMVEFQSPEGKSVRRMGGTGPLPPFLVWDGMDDAGNPAGEGTYRVALMTFDSRNRMLSDDFGKVEIVPLRLHFGIEASGTYFSVKSRKRGNREATFKVNPGGPREVQSWDFEVRDAATDRLVYERKGKNRLPLTLRWNGRTRTRAAAPDGAYQCLLTARDTAGNPLKTGAVSIVLQNTPPELALSPQKGLVDFTPQAGATFNLEATDGAGIGDWKLAVRGDNGKVLKQFTGRGDPPASLGWDGTTDKGVTVDPGSFVQAVLSATDKAGNASSTDPVPLQVDYHASASAEQMTLNLTTVYFQPGSADLGADGKKEIQSASSSLKPYVDKSTLVVKGYAAAGETGDLLTLSHERAEAVRKFLMQSMGIAGGHIYAVGYGVQAGKAPATPEAGRPQGRVIVTLTTQSGG